MSYESFRMQTVANLLPVLPDPDLLDSVLAAIDAAASGYEFTLKSTEIIVYNGIPDAVRLFIASKSVQNLKKGTLQNYYLALFHLFQTTGRRLDEITTNDIRLYLHQYKINRHVQDSRLESLRIIFNGFFEWCVEEDLLYKNPVRRIAPIRVADPERLPMTALELEKVRCSCRKLREKAVVDFLYSTACRVSEFCALNLTDINWQEHTVHIQHGKGDKGRTTYLNPEAEVSLRAYLNSRDDDCPALFVSLRGSHRLSPKSIQNEIGKIVSRAGISIHVTPHIFRHTAASLALQRGMPVEQVQKFLGHARIQTTLRYAKTLDVDVRQSHQRCIA